MQFLKKIIPWKVRIFRSALKIYFADMLKFLRFSSSFDRFDSQTKLKGYLTKTYHVVEKGLTMPDTRLGFGRDNVMKLVNFCRMYRNIGGDLESLEFRHSVSTLNEYVKFHLDRKFELDESLLNAVRSLSTLTGISTTSPQRSATRTGFFEKSCAPFEEFCFSRNSVRHFSKEDIPFEVLHRCAAMAQTSPSPCNRQPNRLYIIKDREVMDKVLKLQNGNRGFGHLGNALIVFTSDLSVFHDTYERNEMYLNSGMFSMSFIYALHSQKIGSCALNWSVPIANDKALRSILDIPDNEVVTLTLVCGYVPENFEVALSPKKSWRDITTDII